MEFIFQISEHRPNELVEQVGKALEKRTELYSRQKLPRLWRFIDRNNRPKVPESVLRRRAIRYKLYAAALLAMGIFLLIPGLMEPDELFVPLVAGAISVALGFVYLLPRRKQASSNFSAAAEKLLAGMQPFEQSADTPALVRFAQEGMILPYETIVPYDYFDAIVETEGIYLLIWKERATVLVKRDLCDETKKAFLGFLERKTGLKPNCLR